MQQRLTQLNLLAFSCGCAAGCIAPLGWPGWLTISTLLQASALRLRLPFLTVCAAFCLAGAYTSLRIMLIPRTLPPTVSRGTVTKVLSPTSRGDQRVLIASEDTTIFRVTIPAFPTATVGDTLTVHTKPKPLAVRSGSQAWYALRYGIAGEISAPKATVSGSDPAYAFTRAVGRLRSTFDLQLNRLIPEPESSFVRGVLLGSGQQFSPELLDQLRKTGTSHIVAMSGANIGLVVGLVTSWIPLDRRWRVVASILVASFMALISGAAASVLRGAVSVAIASYCIARSRRIPALTLLLLCLTILLILNPIQILGDASLQLSCSALAGLILLQKPIHTLIAKVPILTKLPPLFVGIFEETLAASLGSLGVSLALFGKVSWLGLFTNPLILGLLTPLTIVSALCLCLSWVPGINQILAAGCWLIAHAALEVIRISALS